MRPLHGRASLAVCPFLGRSHPGLSERIGHALCNGGGGVLVGLSQGGEDKPFRVQGSPLLAAVRNVQGGGKQRDMSLPPSGA